MHRRRLGRTVIARQQRRLRLTWANSVGCAVVVLATASFSGCRTPGSALSAHPTDRHTADADSQEERDDNEAPCRMVGDCPAAGLARVGAQLDVAGWGTLRSLAKTGLVGLELRGGAVRVDESCRLPGEYVEVARAGRSPGSAWSGSRLVFVPDELTTCPAATHVVAAFAVRDGASQGEAVLLPLPCRGDVCFESGGAAQRRTSAEARYDKIQPALSAGEFAEVLPDLFEFAALFPEPAGYATLARGARIIDREDVGGCFVVGEAEYAADRLDPGSPTSSERPPRPVLEHEPVECRTRPSFTTCFPDLFVPGEGGNCW